LAYLVNGSLSQWFCCGLGRHGSNRPGFHGSILQEDGTRKEVIGTEIVVELYEHEIRDLVADFDETLLQVGGDILVVKMEGPSKAGLRY